MQSLFYLILFKVYLPPRNHHLGEFEYVLCQRIDRVFHSIRLLQKAYIISLLTAFGSEPFSSGLPSDAQSGELR